MGGWGRSEAEPPEVLKAEIGKRKVEGFETTGKASPLRLSAIRLRLSVLSPLPTNLESKFVSRYAGAGSANSVSSHSCDCPRWSRMLLVAFAGWGDVAADVAGIIALIPLVVVFAASDSAFVAGCSVIVEILIDRAEG